MDCASEEQLIRMKLKPMSEVKQLAFDIPNRKLEVYPASDPEPVATAIDDSN
jgi:hypothetical protein